MRSLLLGLALAGTLTPGAQAQTVQAMIPACQIAANPGASPTTAAAYCLGFAAGTNQIMSANCTSLVNGTNSPYALLAANGGGLTGSQVVQVWVNWAQSTPSAWEESFEDSMVWALNETLPCPT